MKALLLPFALAFPFVVSAAEPVVTLAGIQAVFDDGGDDFDGFMTFNAEKGRRVSLIVRSGDKEMVGIDGNKASLTIGGVKAECRFFGDMAFSKDRRALRLEFDTTQEVKTEADGTVKIAGEIPVSFAAGKEEIRSEPFTIEKGAEIKFPADKEGMPVLKVKSSGKPDFSDDPLEIAFSTNRKMDDFAGVRFYTKDGEPVESRRRGSSWVSFGGKGSGEVEFSFEEAHTELIMAVETWTGLEEKTLKVDLAAGLAAGK